MSPPDKKRLKKTVFWEITVVMILLIAANIIISPKDLGFRDFQRYAVNPFLIVILLATIRYGTFWGYYATIVSSLYILLTPPYSISELLLRTPLVALFFALLLLFSQIQEKYAQEIKNLKNEIEEGKKRLGELNQSYEITLFLKDTYEKQILTQTTSMADLYRDAQKMYVLEKEALFSEILNLVKKYVEAQKCSLYTVKDNELHLECHLGYQDYEKKPQAKLSLTDEPYRLVYETRELVGITEEQFKQSILTHFPVYTCPLKTADDQLMAVVNVDMIGLLKFNQISRKTFSLLCEWASKAVENVISYKTIESKRIMDPEFRIYRYHYFFMRLEEALQNVRATGENFTLALIEINRWDRIIERYQVPVIKFTARTVAQQMRDFDLLALSEKDNQLFLLMPGLSEEDLTSLLKRLSKHMETMTLKPFADDTAMSLTISFIRNFKDMSSPLELVKKVADTGCDKVTIPFNE
ncbi:MAG: diguanylate cyclase domain-containing protein [Candidatus Xenobiia bacterium LiM19]